MIEPRRDLRLFDGYHSPQVDVGVRLNTNESPLPPPEKWVEDVAGLVREVRWNRYPDRSASELRRSLAEFHGVDTGMVFVANGSNEVIQTILLTFGGPERKALVFEPTYQLHSHISRVTGTSVATARRDEEFLVGPDSVSEAIREHDPDLVFFCSPNNPTGRCEDPDAVERALLEARGLVIVDEAYAEFAPVTWIDRVGSSDKLVVVRTFSKTWSMAAARLGYAVCPPEVVRHLEEVVLPYHLDSFKQKAGVLALRHVEEMRARVARIVEERERLADAMTSSGAEVWPSEANFLLFRPRGIEARVVWEGLLRRGVLVRDCTGWPGLPDCLRVTVGLPEENDAFVRALRDVTRDA
ncbi:MAG: histidinol-phosphate aminotransferase [Acidimicrobiales bacterium]|nr:MAG: histidinol-phosphate aminotransferase [Acidimicrobiales bacterium]